jgi:hypothetical protein
VEPHKQARREWTDSERAKLDELAAESSHRKWLADLLKRWALWIAAVVVGGRYLWDGISELLRYLRDQS